MIKMGEDIKIRVNPILLGLMGVEIVGFLNPKDSSSNGNREQEINNYAPDNGEKDQRVYNARDSC